MPTVNWHNARGEMIVNGGNFHLQQVIATNNYCTMFQFPSESCGNRLVCKAMLSYSTDAEPLVKTLEYSIAHSDGGRNDDPIAKEVTLILVPSITIYEMH